MRTFLRFLRPPYFIKAPTPMPCSLDVGDRVGGWCSGSAGLGMWSTRRIALTMLICLGLGVSGFAFSRSYALSCVMLFFTGLSMMGVFSMVSSLVQWWSRTRCGAGDECLQLDVPRWYARRKRNCRLAHPMFTAPNVFVVNGGFDGPWIVLFCYSSAGCEPLAWGPAEEMSMRALWLSLWL